MSGIDRSIGELLVPLRSATVAIAFIPSQSEAKPAIFSCFGVKCADQIYLVTAGHVLEAIDKAFEQYPEGRLRLKSITSKGFSTPWRLEPFSWTSLSETFKTLSANGGLDVQGDYLDPSLVEEIDIGVMRLGPLYVDNLRADGFRPLELNALGFPQRDELESLVSGGADVSCYVHGALEESVEVTDPDNDFEYIWAILPIGIVDTSQPRFAFEPLWDRTIYSRGVKGMSGGPVGFLGRDGVRVVAVQSCQSTNGSAFPTKLHAWDAQFIEPILRALVERDQIQN